MPFENFTSDSIASGELFPTQIISPELLDLLLLSLFLLIYLLDVLFEDFAFVLVHVAGDVQVAAGGADDGDLPLQHGLHVL